MRAIKLKAAVDERAMLSVSLPSDVPSGTVEVIVLLEQDAIPPKTAVDGDSFDELLAFHRDHRLDGVTLQELIAEGRR